MNCFTTISHKYIASCFYIFPYSQGNAYMFLYGKMTNILDKRNILLMQISRI